MPALARIAVVVCVSVGLHLGGFAGVALIVGGGLPLAIAGVAGLFFGFLLAFGRNARWN